MRIGILGAGRIGGTIAARLSAAGHAVQLANSRGPETIRDLAAAAGATAAHVRAAVTGADVVITSVPFPQLPSLREDLAFAPGDAVIIDTSNYFPFKDGVIAGVGAGEVESTWVADQLGRPIIKAWNNILAGSFATKASAVGMPGRIALAVAGDDATGKAIAMDLVEATGFDAVDSGGIADSWRQQPGTPAYCTELDAAELRRALASADRSRLAERRDLMVTRMLGLGGEVSNDDLLRLSREVYL
ncbi:NAD(P)-binding domain-containing protein [Pseudarthrobacter sulfonivorans]|uniref:NADPH-dependent F420 reductase n=1 Tax=Pseudarthrobacter sulfonivorans TaxID=121292 RepID=UPI00168B0CDB|nr:NAD(P)-binding domain-containing protein [Pseudarthrobacter sulfonivorans]